MSENLLIALVSGCTALGVTALATYPLDFIKTQQQLNNVGYMKRWKVPGNYPLTLAQLYTGSSALVIGSILKNLTRLILYNWLLKFMSTGVDSEHHQKVSAPRIVIAGAISGFIETLCIIPFENVKITMIQNMTLQNELTKTAGWKYDITGAQAKQLPNIFGKQYVSPHAYYTSELVSQYRGHKLSRFTHHTPSLVIKSVDALKVKYNHAPTLTFVNTFKEMYQLKGILAFTAGTGITIVRQVAVLTAWIWSYNATRQLINPLLLQQADQGWFGHQHTAIQLIGLHFLLSVAVVALTQPLDVLKTQMQLKNGKAVYRDSLTTAYKLFVVQGPKALFRGALPRGLKVLVNGGLTALVYNWVEDVVVATDLQNVFAT